MRKRIAIINQRYGMEVNGGSEYYTRLIAEHLNHDYQVEVITTQALDYDTWKNSYPEKEEKINGVCVRRFPVRRQRNIAAFRVVNKITGIFGKYMPVLEKWWIKEQGPYCPDLIQYLKANKNNFDLFVFVTYLYYPTWKGIPEAENRSILIPTAHDEPYIYFKSYKKVFEKAGAYIYLTEEEKKFVERLFRNETKNKLSRILGVGIEVPEDVGMWKPNAENDPYFIYIGRVDYGKTVASYFKILFNIKKTRNLTASLL